MAYKLHDIYSYSPPCPLELTSHWYPNQHVYILPDLFCSRIVYEIAVSWEPIKLDVDKDVVLCAGYGDVEVTMPDGAKRSGIIADLPATFIPKDSPQQIGEMLVWYKFTPVNVGLPPNQLPESRTIYIPPMTATVQWNKDTATTHIIYPKCYILLYVLENVSEFDTLESAVQTAEIINSPDCNDCLVLFGDCLNCWKNYPYRFTSRMAYIE